MSDKHICDCGAIYSHVDQLHYCSSTGHGKNLDRAGDSKYQQLKASHARLLAALEWALPLARLCLEDTRLTRLQSGLSDIGAGTHHIGLWPDEIEKYDNARNAIKEAKEI